MERIPTPDEIELLRLADDGNPPAAGATAADPDPTTYRCLACGASHPALVAATCARCRYAARVAANNSEA
jgi:hypothetical protein